MINAGQSCIAAKRFIIQKNVFEEFTDGLSEKVRQLSIGDPFDRSTDIGPLTRKDLVLQVDAQVKESVQKGAHVLFGGRRLQDLSGYYYYPTIF